MKQSLRDSRLALMLLVVLIVLLHPPASAAAGLVSGHYNFTVKVSPVCLNGIYPVSLRGVRAGSLSMSTLANGQITGDAKLRGTKASLSGHAITRRDFVGLSLKLVNGREKVVMGGRILGQSISDTVEINGIEETFTIDLSAVDSLRLTFDLDLQVGATGRVTGTGKLAACGQELAVTVTGSSKAKKCTLQVKGADRFSFATSGVPRDAGFNAQWTCRGFGAKVRGRNLLIEPSSQ